MLDSSQLQIFQPVRQFAHEMQSFKAPKRAKICHIGNQPHITKNWKCFDKFCIPCSIIDVQLPKKRNIDAQIAKQKGILRSDYFHTDKRKSPLSLVESLLMRHMFKSSLRGSSSF